MPGLATPEKSDEVRGPALEAGMHAECEVVVSTARFTAQAGEDPFVKVDFKDAQSKFWWKIFQRKAATGILPALRGGWFNLLGLTTLSHRLILS